MYVSIMIKESRENEFEKEQGGSRWEGLEGRKEKIM